ncbi:LEA type 2 family protein [Zoogloea sp.]|uniref:LEA type 2 family protein n=1 Tax=Zoogloea sp. TaxID=49181 RepID=UPI0025FEF945|nr:LEA type 2 family protein [Zoogloea sp.]MCK6395895.1 LEA type 2 family protein [Zoogloea sp.]
MKQISRRRMAGLLCAGLGLTVLGGCAGFQFGMQKPEVTVVDIRPLDATLLEQRFVLSLRVTNPNSVEIPIEGLTFRLDLSGQQFATGVSNRPVVIPRLGEGIVEVTATTSLPRLLRQFRELAKMRDKVEYRLRGRLVTGNFGGFDFDQTGEVGLPKGFGEAGRRESAPPTERF